MSAGILLIDGYNLLHAAGMAQSQYGPGDLLRCRTRLLRFLLSRLTAAEISGTTVVFDARDPPPDRPAEVVVSGIRILFANPGGDADVMIQSWLARQRSPKRVTLVSSDRMLQRAARSYGSKYIGSDDFLHALAERGAKRATGGRKSPADEDAKPGAAAVFDQTAYWLKVFADAAVAEPADDEKPAVPTRRESETAKKHQSKPPAASREQKRTRSPGAEEESRRHRTVENDEVNYWMNVFGGQAAAGPAPASSEELRLSDLENWLKDFDAAERDAAKKRR